MSPSSSERPPEGRILVVDDQRNMRATTAMLLREGGHHVLEAAHAEEALEILGKEPVELLLTDLRMAPLSGIELLTRALELSPDLQVIVMTAFGSIESAVEAMRLGAYDYITKPFQEGELLHRVKRALERSRLLSAVDLFAGEFNSRHGLTALVGRSQVMRDLTARIVRAAPSDATVLIQGESGTGKELVAKAVHACSRRKDRPFVPVNCAAISEGLLESELFGHARGAFTGATRARRGLFEEANGGTLFIDEVTETAPSFQSKLLRALQDGEVRRVGESTSLRVDVRTVAATNRDLDREVAEKRFRQDLFYRLNVVTLHVPPLRERREDVPLLVEYFLSRINGRSDRPKRMAPGAVEHLMGYAFPGNVRELENLVEQAAALSESETLSADDFPLREPRISETRSHAEELPSLAHAVEQAEKDAIAAALAKHSEDLHQVAVTLGVSPTTLWRKMKRFGLRWRDTSPDPSASESAR